MYIYGFIALTGFVSVLAGRRCVLSGTKALSTCLSCRLVRSCRRHCQVLPL